MDFQLSSDIEDLKKGVNKFIQEEVDPLAMVIERDNEFRRYRPNSKEYHCS